MNTLKFDFDSFKMAGEQFMMRLTSQLLKSGIPADNLKSDHLCFRVGSSEEYNFYKTALLHHGKLLTEAMVNGRPIATFGLTSAFKTHSHEIPLLELPAPKPGSSYSTGFEHAEFLIDECFNSFRSRYPNLNFSAPSKQILNPELCLKLGKDMQAKFHHHGLDRVIEIEESKIKDILFDFDGTLIKSRENIYEINRIVFSNTLGREISSQESIDNYHPEFSKLFKAFEVSCPEKQAQAIARWGTVSAQFSYELFDGVLETLNELKNHGYQMHLWTARDELSARKILKDHNLESFFTTLSFATPVDSKPHANSLSFDWQGASKNQVIVIGDSPSDIIGAKNISAIRAAALWDSHTNKSTLISAGSELFFDKLTDFKDWIVKAAKEVS